jgi:hypothetical protein
MVSRARDAGRTFGFAGLRIAVAGNDEAALDWLFEFLHPNFAVSDSGADCLVCVIADAGSYAERLAATGRGRRREADCFARDTGMIRLPTSELGDGRRLVHDESFRVVYRLDPARRTIEVCAAAPTPQLRVSLMRAVRELAMNHAVAQGGLLIHGAALRWNGRGIAVVGPKGAGKTTLLMAALAARGAEFVANDRLAVRDTGAGWSAQGVPTIVSIRAPTVSAHARIRRELAARTFRHAQTLAEALDAGPAPRPGDAGRISVSPAQFAYLTGAVRAGSTPLDAIVFPTVDPGAPVSTAVPVAPSVAADRLRAGSFRATQPAGTGTVFAEFAAAVVPGPRQSTVGRDALAAAIPCYDAVIGADVLNDPVRAGGLMASLLDRAPGAAAATSPRLRRHCA